MKCKLEKEVEKILQILRATLPPYTTKCQLQNYCDNEVLYLQENVQNVELRGQRVLCIYKKKITLINERQCALRAHYLSYINWLFLFMKDSIAKRARAFILYVFYSLAKVNFNEHFVNGVYVGKYIGSMIILFIFFKGYYFND